MNNIIHSFSNREISTIVWFIIFLLYVCIAKSVRESIIDVLKALFTFKVYGLILITFSYIGVIVFLFYLVKLWDFSLLKDTIFYTTFYAVPLFFKMTRKVSLLTFKEIAFENVKVTSIIIIYLNLFNLSLLGELILVPLFAFLLLMYTFTKKSNKMSDIKINACLSKILMFMVISMIVYCVYMTFKSPNVLLSFQFIKSLLLPIVLTLLYIPLLYLIFLYAEYEEWFIDIKLSSDQSKYKYRIKKILKTCKMNINKMIFFETNLKVYKSMETKQFDFELKRVLEKYHNK